MTWLYFSVFSYFFIFLFPSWRYLICLTSAKLHELGCLPFILHPMQMRWEEDLREFPGVIYILWSYWFFSMHFKTAWIVFCWVKRDRWEVGYTWSFWITRVQYHINKYFIICIVVEPCSPVMDQRPIFVMIKDIIKIASNNK